MIPPEVLERAAEQTAPRLGLVRQVERGLERALEREAPVAVKQAWGADGVSLSRQAVETVRGRREPLPFNQPKPPARPLVVRQPVGLPASIQLKNVHFARGQFQGMSMQQVIEGLRSGKIDPAVMLTNRTFKGHVLRRHGPDARVPGKTRFLRDFDIRQAIYDTLKSPDTRVAINEGENKGFKFELTYPRPIARNARGKPVNTLKVAVGWDGKVITAYGVK